MVEVVVFEARSNNPLHVHCETDLDIDELGGRGLLITGIMQVVQAVADCLTIAKTGKPVAIRIQAVNPFEDEQPFNPLDN